MLPMLKESFANKSTYCVAQAAASPNDLAKEQCNSSIQNILTRGNKNGRPLETCCVTVVLDCFAQMAADFKSLQIKRYPKLADRPKADTEYWKKFQVSYQNQKCKKST